MANMKAIMPALQKAKPAKVSVGDIRYLSVALPKARRETRIVKNAPADEIAREIVEWISKD
jgi:electron transfer flavoprotein beta subunit